MSTSRERFLQQLERCVRYQNMTIPEGPRIVGEQETWAETGGYVAPTEMGNGEDVHCDASAVWGLRPPGDDPTPIDYCCTGDWA